jgi:hypothetical protein
MTASFPLAETEIPLTALIIILPRILLANPPRSKRPETRYCSRRPLLERIVVRSRPAAQDRRRVVTNKFKRALFTCAFIQASIDYVLSHNHHKGLILSSTSLIYSSLHITMVVDGLREEIFSRTWHDESKPISPC